MLASAGAKGKAMSRNRRCRSSERCSGRSYSQEIEHRGLRQHRLRNAVALRARALLGGLRRLQIGAEMARALNDAVTDRKPCLLETRQRGGHAGSGEGLGE